MHAAYLRQFGTNSPFGNLRRIASGVLSRMDEINRLLLGATVTWCDMVEGKIDPDPTSAHGFQLEYTLFQMCRAADSDWPACWKLSSLGVSINSVTTFWPSTQRLQKSVVG